MIELIYMRNGGTEPGVKLYKLVDGTEVFVKPFDDVEDMLMFIEDNYDKAILYVNI